MNEETLEVCAACGSPDVEISETEKFYTAPFGPQVPYKERAAFCTTCGAKVNISDRNAFPKAIQESEIKSVDMILSNLKDIGYSHAAIERSFGLPSRALSNWKSKEALSKSGLALLRIARALPWVIDIADGNFDSEFTKNMEITKGVDEILKARSEPNFNQMNLFHSSVSGDVQQTNIGLIGQTSLTTPYQGGYEIPEWCFRNVTGMGNSNHLQAPSRMEV